MKAQLDMMKIKFTAIPTLKIGDYGEAVAFYVDLLGFKLDWENRTGPEEPVYMQVSGRGLTLHLSENERFSPKTFVYIDTLDLNGYHQELTGKKTGFYLPNVEQTPWGTRQIEIEDPFGNVLRFNEPI